MDFTAVDRTRVKCDVGMSLFIGTTATVDRLDAMCLLKTSFPKENRTATIDHTAPPTPATIVWPGVCTCSLTDYSPAVEDMVGAESLL